MEWLTGVHSVLEALRAGRRELRRLEFRADRQDRGELEEIRRLAEERRLEIAPLRPQGGGRDDGQGVRLEAGALPELDLEPLLALARNESPWLVALDGVEDPHNVGAVARVAEACGCSGLILTRRHAPPLSPAVSRASAGAIEHLPVGRVANLKRALEALRGHGFWSIGADMGGDSLYGMDARSWQGPLVFVLGAEGRGLRPGVRDAVDFRVEIPMLGRVDSLNVSTAAAVMLYEGVRRAGNG
ncbi:MAG: 23S rRNA (guanosine(2251)-2'-O)-methyltransferase RlmB [bacterium]|nr:23S rRNA (guanosine(2251)-2'-O)-methyltransferase RlmB [bacterium]MCP5066232.1 23S rRNA (guanosine(2251)-2'-O)-methyltransferase RlmB [bacterium]